MDGSDGGFQQPQGNLGQRYRGATGRGGPPSTDQTTRVVNSGIPPTYAFTHFSSTFSDPGASNLGLLSPNATLPNFTYSQPHDPNQTSLGAFQLHAFNDGSTSAQDLSARYMQPHPMDRFRHGGEDPWSVQRLGGQSNPAPTRTVHFNTWRDPVIPSDADSQGLSRPRSDSGYSTAPRSVYNGHAGTQDVSDVMSQFGNYQPYSGGRHPSSRYSNASGTPRKPEELKCPYCPDEFRLHSDLKKHVLKHEKPFKCDQRSCDRAFEGFPTVNDLARHQASRHKIYPDGSRVYVCSSVSCAERSKIWPRLDNFKQHIDRMHKTEDADDLVDRSSRTIGVDLSNPSDPLPIDPHQPSYMPLGTATDPANNRNPLEASSSTLNFQAPHFPNAQPQVGWAEEQTLRGRNLSTASHSFSDGYSRNPPMLEHGHGVFQRVAQTPFVLADTTGGTLDALAEAATVSAPLETFENHPAMSGENRNTNVIVHQDPKQQQEQELADLSLAIASQCEKKLPAEKMEDTILKVLKTFEGSAILKKTLELLDSEDADDTSQSSRARFTGRDGNSRYPCNHCGKTFRLRCHLAKHRSRHSRHFRCTADNCNYACGTKNDWKRHENTKHFQSEAWRCNIGVEPTGQLDPTPVACAKVFKHRVQFLKHLKGTHKVTDEAQMKRISEERRVGANGQTRFWCGFCKDIITLENRGFKAWNERFDHIGKHFIEQGLKIEDWLSFNLNITKGQNEQSGKEGDDTTTRRHGRGRDAESNELEANTAQQPSEALTKKRFLVEEDFDRERLPVCCMCNQEEIPIVSGMCPSTSCQHVLCRNCTTPKRKTKRRSWVM